MLAKSKVNQQASQPVAATQPGNEEFYNSPLFSQAVVAGDTVWLSGLLGSRQEEARAFTVDEQVRIALQTLARALERASAAVVNITELTTQPIDLNHLSKFDWQEEGFDPKSIPDWTAVGVLASQLVGYQIEVKAIPLK